MNTPIAALAWTGLHASPWKLIGWLGAGMFSLRWAVQLLASRRAGRPVIPRLFWIMSVTGSALSLAYFTLSAKQDSVGVLQNLFPAMTSVYSLYLDIRSPRQRATDAADGGSRDGRTTLQIEGTADATS
ncbi:hypothetical protein DWG18_02055 [Lysobacter sp. TY2-98]|nr:hypothetical protein DWG18_02055 [Lysobacter sp. TY2-98]